MNSSRKTAIIVGVLYIAGTAAGITSVVFGSEVWLIVRGFNPSVLASGSLEQLLAR